ncbi:hypothetical protein PPYR_01339 [Photinus pyralis]|uniref:Uncharacterized protein n=1 Tax=Photinus pyralis TaxID=7054 RepID=A0A5N4A0J2_PHOPY|nr:uncharacterized protein LOC116159529 isoform X2 [Photinus pyralis]XP_031358461.1 uncharacterized protein LOC116182097 isoform X2 [Photinus pyralis]KAB0790809.1 hypothetical protein PPYR_15199 [Photinus pyralis]KAB0804369.1 hypothetical protein PPYR_01339 [Photinus pyralis]
MCSKNGRLRFTTTDDLDLLRAVAAENPFEDILRWGVIHETVVTNTGKPFTLRALKDHLEYLLKLFIQEDKANIKKSGTEEEYEEKERLLQELHDLRREFTSKATSNQPQVKSKSKADQSTSKKCGIEVREKAAQESKDGTLVNETRYNKTLVGDVGSSASGSNDNAEVSSGSSTPTLLEPSHKRIKREDKIKGCLEFLNKRTYQEYELKQKQLNLEERRLALEEKKLAVEVQKLEAEKEERKIQLDAEITERKNHTILMQQQQHCYVVY